MGTLPWRKEFPSACVYILTQLRSPDILFLFYVEYAAIRYWLLSATNGTGHVLKHHIMDDYYDTLITLKDVSFVLSAGN
jgi:hypothetical protein